MAAQTYDILFNLIANVQGFRKAEHRVNRLNRALDRLNRKLSMTNSNLAAVGGFGGAGKTGSGAAIAGAAGSAGINNSTKRGGRRGAGIIYPSPKNLAFHAARGGGGGSILPYVAGFGGLYFAGKGLQIQMQRQQQAMKSYALSNKRERSIYFPPNFNAAQTNPIWRNMSLRYGIPQEEMSVAYDTGKTYQMDFAKLLGDDPNNFGRLLSSLSIFATDTDKMKRAWLALGQLYTNDIIETRDARQLSEIGYPIFERFKEKTGTGLREAIEMQQRMTDSQRDEFRTGLVQMIIDDLLERPEYVDIVKQREEGNLLFVEWNRLKENTSELARSFAQGLDDQGQFVTLMKSMNKTIIEFMPAFNQFGKILSGVLTSLAYGTGKNIARDDEWWGQDLFSWEALASPMAFSALALDPNYGPIRGPALEAEMGIEDMRGRIDLRMYLPRGVGASVSKSGRGTSKFDINIEEFEDNGFLRASRF